MSFKMRHLEQFCHFGPFLCHLRGVIHHNFVTLDHFNVTLDQYVTFHVTLDIVSKDNFSTSEVNYINCIIIYSASYNNGPL